MHSDEIAFPTTGLHPPFVRLASGPSWCWQKDQSPAVAQGSSLPLSKKKKGNWETFVKRCEKYGPKLNPGSVIFVDGNLFGVVEMVGNFERELYGTTVGSIFGSASLALRQGMLPHQSPTTDEKSLATAGLFQSTIVFFEQSWIWIRLHAQNN